MTPLRPVYGVALIYLCVLASASRVLLNVNTNDPLGMLMMKGRMSQPSPSGMSRVRETASSWTYTPPSRSETANRN